MTAELRAMVRNDYCTQCGSVKKCWSVLRLRSPAERSQQSILCVALDGMEALRIYLSSGLIEL